MNFAHWGQLDTQARLTNEERKRERKEINKTTVRKKEGKKNRKIEINKMDGQFANEDKWMHKRLT